MRYSAHLAVRRPARKDGTCQVRLVAVLNRRSVPLALGVNWWSALFDEEMGRCLASRPPRKRGSG